MKLEKYLSEETLSRLSSKQKIQIWHSIRNRIPILFTGAAAVGKTFIAKELRKKGIIAYAPEMLCEVELGEKRKKRIKYERININNTNAKAV